MIASFSVLLYTAAIAIASPVVEVRTVASLNQAAFAEAQQRDNTATRAFSSTEIKTSDGQCLFVDELSGDFRANLNPIQVGVCNGSTGQLWDIITSGVHLNVPGEMLIVNTLTQACMNFDNRRAEGDKVIMFSCGGRADGGGTVTPSQQFAFSGGAGPLSLQTSAQLADSSQVVCMTVASGNLLQEANCTSDATQLFTFGGGNAGAAVSVSEVSASSTASLPPVSSAAAQAGSSTATGCVATTTVTITRSAYSGSASSPVKRWENNLQH